MRKPHEEPSASLMREESVSSECISGEWYAQQHMPLQTSIPAKGKTAAYENRRCIRSTRFPVNALAADNFNQRASRYPVISLQAVQYTRFFDPTRRYAQGSYYLTK